MEARLAERLRLLLLRREHRLGRALARAELARRISVSKSSLYAYLKGTTVPRADVFDRLLVELDAEPAEMRELSTLRDAIEVAQHREPRRAGTLPVPRQLPPPTRRFARRAADLERPARREHRPAAPSHRSPPAPAPPAPAPRRSPPT
ncbi:helix-turn-helix transcriptional regulator, partial [Actinomadura sp. BRA 177]|uniref:helix-turn-helix domain-containing protein n=1 Tax=Actinomadura sp. BRA 177 TaxID=2745202 RepID=UPI00159525D3